MTRLIGDHDVMGTKCHFSHKKLEIMHFKLADMVFHVYREAFLIVNKI